MPDEPVVVDVICKLCKHAWSIELPKKEAESPDSIKCPNCKRGGGEKVFMV